MGLKQPSPLGRKKRGRMLEQSVEEKKGELETLHIRFGVGVGSLPCVMIHGGTQERRVGALERTE